MLGGWVSIIAALGHLRVSSRPSSLQITQLILKPLAGAPVALFGIVLAQGGLFAQLQSVSSGAIAAYAVLFGFAQQTLTRMVEKKRPHSPATPTRPAPRQRPRECTE